MYEPKDNEKFRKLFEPKGRGVCGVSVLAVLTRQNLKDIFMVWDKYKGHATLKEMRKYIELLGYETKFHNGKKAKNFEYVEKKIHILRIQWIGKEGGKFHGYSNWHDATCNTHWILVDSDMYYCNEGGWAELRWLPEYLENGYITSFLEVEKIAKP